MKQVRETLAKAAPIRTQFAGLLSWFSTRDRFADNYIEYEAFYHEIVLISKHKKGKDDSSLMPLFTPFFRLPGRWTRRRARRTRMAIQAIVLIVFLLVFIPIYTIYKPPKIVINYLQSRFPEVLFQVHANRKVVALTIDDAPTEYTGQILGVLKANNASATFFVIGNQVSQREDVLKDIISSGSELGNHAMRDEPSLSLSSETLRTQIDQVDESIDLAYNSLNEDRPAHYFRPGSGFFGRRVLDVAASAGHTTILGSIYPHDPFIKYWRINAWHILSMVRPGAVIICHDRRAWTLPMLRKVLPALRKKGYEVVTVSKLLEIANG